MTSTAEDALVGRTLEGRYRVVERLARGGMSTVYIAVDERLDRQVALKVMSGHFSADPAFVNRFGREARAAARLAHINAVAVYDQGSDGDHVFLVMELVRGRTLRDLLRERGPLPPAEAISVIEPVLAALAAAHRAGLVHRDIKPENVLIADSGLIKVADFGLARAIEQDVNDTRTGVMMGTVAYCSPEQLSRGVADARSDVYSTGVVLFELLTGRTPFTGETPIAVAYQHVHSDVPAPSSFVGGLDPRLDELVLRATQREPSARPMDAGAFLAEVHDTRVDLGLPIVSVAVGRGPGPVRRPDGQRTGTTGVTRPVQPNSTDSVPAPGRPNPTMVGLPPVAAAASAPPRAAAPRAKDRRARNTPLVDQRRRKLRRKRRATAIVVLLVLLLGAAVGYGGWWYASGRYMKVPDVGNATAADARSQLDKAGLKVADKTQTAFSETISKDRVISTDPPAGSRILSGKSVTLVVSAGAERFTVPDVAGKSQADAQAAFSGMPLNVVLSQKADDSVPAGAAIGTDPAAGTAVKRNQNITLFISTGLPVLEVPDVTGQPQNTASKTLTDAGFKVNIDPAFSDDVPSGNVISQSPGGKSRQEKFSTITLTVSKGQDLVTVPSISFPTPLASAKATLEAAGLTVATKQGASYVGLNFAISMDTTAGSKVKRGSTVTLTLI